MFSFDGRDRAVQRPKSRVSLCLGNPARLPVKFAKQWSREKAFQAEGTA